MDSDIEFGEVELPPAQVQLRPDRNRHFVVVPVHQPSECDLPIFVDLDVMRDVEAHAQSDRRVELGGVLLGGQFSDEQGRPFVLVTDSLRAQHYASTKGSFTFTHATWETITREREQFPADLQMVGWYHTHPDWGVFLSGLDMFICDNFFNKPLDVALVIDPCQRDRGFFQWAPQTSSRIRRTDGFYLMASRFRAAELQSHAAQLESKTKMAHDSSHLPPTHSSPVIHVAMPTSLGTTLALFGMLSLQFCCLLLVAWRLVLAEGEVTLAGQAASHRDTMDRPAATSQREADLDAKLEVLELVIRQATNAPEGVLRTLTEQTAQVHELRSSLRGQQSLSRELDSQLGELEASLADARRRDNRQQAELAALESRVANLIAQLGEARAQIQTVGAGDPQLLNDVEGSWWSSLRANSQPIGLGALLGAAAVGVVLAALQQARKPQPDGPSAETLAQPDTATPHDDVS